MTKQSPQYRGIASAKSRRLATTCKGEKYDLWGGRFAQQPDQLAFNLNASLSVDQRMALQDVDGSIAWADAIHKAGILSDEEHASISRGLDTVRKEFSSGEFSFLPSDEDIHTAVERRLTELIGEAAGKLHTGQKPQ